MIKNEILNNILDELNKLTAQVKDIIAEKEEIGFVFKDKDEDTSERVFIEDDYCIVAANHGYSCAVENLCELKDTGNGYIAYFPSYSSVNQDNYICIDYSEADYLLKALTFLKNKK
jgi:hypothetical protein